MPFAASVGLGLALRFLVPVPAGITLQAWSLLSIFVSAIAGATGLPMPPARMSHPVWHFEHRLNRDILPSRTPLACWRTVCALAVVSEAGAGRMTPKPYPS